MKQSRTGLTFLRERDGQRRVQVSCVYGTKKSREGVWRPDPQLTSAPLTCPPSRNWVPALPQSAGPQARPWVALTAPYPPWSLGGTLLPPGQGLGLGRGSSRNPRRGGRGGSWFWEGQVGMTVPGHPCPGRGWPGPGRAAAAEAARGGSYLGHETDVRAGVGAWAAAPRSGGSVRLQPGPGPGPGTRASRSVQAWGGERL